ncbi:hypothetical protein [Mycolicibacterium tusciae]|uniref:carboxylate--amine ligase n=1 Tax=Mycolicibacterium tusciae TaxID=75922 RepID=UPI00024A2255|nr:hypothetical protein [Mycolicibacterium tusciae]
MRHQLDVDRSVPALVVKVGQYSWHHGSVGAIRSLGRLGIPVYAVTEDRWTPAAASRYLRDRFVWRTTGLEDPAWLIEGLLDIGRRIGRPTVLVPTDDEIAVLIAEHADDLRGAFLFPDVEPTLPRRLASKRGLAELCTEHGVPTPWAAFPTTTDELDRVASEAAFPLVVKNLEAFERHRARAVAGTTVVRNATELRALARPWGREFSVVLQDYVPRGDAEDWIVNAYCDASTTCRVQFTGVKVRSFPPHVGMTSSACALPNPALVEMTAHFVKRVGYRGAADLDWRYDPRDGQYKLLDFNPRVGAQFRVFETDEGIDVVRALHMDLTGRDIPPADQVDGRRLVIENFDVPAMLAYRVKGYPTPQAAATANTVELAWLARDDLKPFFVMLARFIPQAAKGLLQLWFARRRSRPRP